LAVPGSPERQAKQPQAKSAAGAEIPTLLVEEHEIVTLPSASALAVLRRETGQRKPAPKAVAVLADPVFEQDDSRVLLANKKPAPAAGQPPMVAELHPTLRDFILRGDGRGLPRLISSGEEARGIMALIPKEAGMIATGFDASLAKAMSADLSQYRIVHFATHGLLNSEHPELSSIVLSLVDKQGR